MTQLKEAMECTDFNDKAEHQNACIGNERECFVFESAYIIISAIVVQTVYLDTIHFLTTTEYSGRYCKILHLLLNGDA